MAHKRISPTAIYALSEALSVVFWYKKDLRAFLTRTVRDTSLVVRADWGSSSYKRDIVDTLVTHMEAHEDAYQDDLLALMVEVARMDDFSHLERLEDGKRKGAEARAAVVALRTAMGNLDSYLQDRAAAQARRDAAAAQVIEVRGMQEKLAELRDECQQLVVDPDHQRRGYRLERIMKDLFGLFDLDPRASFRLVGEQIDGSFTFDSTDYLFEGKWQNELVGIEALDAFRGKVERKHVNTMGLFLSMGGFSGPGVQQFSSSGRRSVILMDGMDLMAVLDGRIELPELLLRKRREAGQTGGIYLQVRDILSGVRGG